MNEIEKREYFEYLKKEWKKAEKKKKKFDCEVYFDALEAMHLAELSEFLNEDGFAYKVLNR